MEEDLYDSLDTQYDEEAEAILNEYGYNDEEEPDDWEALDDFSVEDDWLNDFIFSEEDKKPVYRVGKPQMESFTDNIIQKESGGNYQAYNPAGGGEGAVGKYQFRWGLHKDKIRKFAGNSNLSKEQFMNSPELQDNFYEQYWIPNEISPSVSRIKKNVNTKLSDQQLASLVHFRGEEGALNYLLGKVKDKPESYNMSISGYIGKQTGGNILGLTDEALGEIDKQGSQVLEGTDKVLKFFRDRKARLGQVLSTGVEAGIGLLSQQQQSIQNREMLERLYQDNPNQYGVANRNLNNIPVYTQYGGKFKWKK